MSVYVGMNLPIPLRVAGFLSYDQFQNWFIQEYIIICLKKQSWSIRFMRKRKQEKGKMP